MQEWNTRNSSKKTRESTYVKSVEKSVENMCRSVENNEILQCYLCSVTFPHSQMLDHFQVSHPHNNYGGNFGPRRKFSCGNCHIAMNDYTGHKCERPKFECDICDFPCFNAQALKLHKMKKHEDIKCEICDKVFGKWDSYKRHMISHQNEKPYVCETCGLNFKKKQLLVKHTKRIHEKEYKFSCEQCNEKFFERYNLKLHVKTVHLKEFNYQCEDCGRKYAELHKANRCICKNRTPGTVRKRLENLPMNTEELEKLPKLTCDICEKVFVGQDALQAHKELGHKMNVEIPVDKSKYFKCGNCDKSYVAKYMLERHVKVHHPTQEVLNSIESKCGNCGIHFGSANQLNFHLSSCCPHNLKDFTCKECNLGNWHSTGALRRHYAEAHKMDMEICDISGCRVGTQTMKEHIQSRHGNFKCDKCEKVFGTKHKLFYHKAHYHEGKLKRFKCDKCDFSTTERTKLKNHYAVQHDQAVKYQCHACKFSSYIEYNLKLHVRNVHEGKRELNYCSFCTQSFVTKKGLRKHIVLKH